MDAVVFHSQYVNFPSFVSFSKQLKLGRPVQIFKDSPWAFASQNHVLQLSVSSTKSDERKRSRLPRKGSALGRTEKEDVGKKLQFSGGKIHRSPKQEEILALFRRIQSSISKALAKQSNASLSPTESILEVLHQSKKPREGTIKGEGDKALAQKRGVAKKENTLDNDVQDSAANFNLTRPPTNFVRRSPIPPTTIPTGNTIELNSDSSATKEEKKLVMPPKIDEMKLPELRELAKSRGMKGYSKLKKGKLLELLRSSKL
ncbi:hypothetical protein JCGZ_21591 [Jatropha curcas]|uniref:Rho termination factor-like N-terminal domain-containing protein n=1 Tax=Jatropha curcas TaxID=180498 RepID=A0A067JM97_JATCU|nr:uncharacterized protein LOC105649691 [Jatropha curcas]KDP21120.1 hypothetical protein JCGZ_21591 [Jatropha curcas]